MIEKLFNCMYGYASGYTKTDEYLKNMKKYRMINIKQIQYVLVRQRNGYVIFGRPKTNHSIYFSMFNQKIIFIKNRWIIHEIIMNSDNREVILEKLKEWTLVWWPKNTQLRIEKFLNSLRDMTLEIM